MRQPERSSQRTALKQLVVEASRALAQLDADRLEALAVSCSALNRDFDSAESMERECLASGAADAAGEMVVFGRVLDATRANMHVMGRALELQKELPAYGPDTGRSW
jgi:hypothetical protein